jgi:hypothetical protein
MKAFSQSLSSNGCLPLVIFEIRLSSEDYKECVTYHKAQSCEVQIAKEHVRRMLNGCMCIR